MKLVLRDIENFPAQVHLEADAGTFKVNYDMILEVGRVAVDLDIQKSGDEFFCQGEVEADVVLECSRCLTSFEETLNGQTDFIVCAKDTWADAQAEAKDDEDYVLVDGGSLEADITEQVRQAIILAAPMVPLCAEDCKGFCPKCKVNRNEQKCSCTFDDTDPRWDQLNDLRG